MANATVPALNFSGPGGGGAECLGQVVFAGPDVPGGVHVSDFSVVLLGTDTAVNIRNKLSSAVVTEATRLGYVVATADITLPAYQKG